MKAIINFSKRTNWFKASMALITCLLFLIPPSCEKLEPNQDSLLNTDEMTVTAKSASSSAKMYWGPAGFSKDWPGGSWSGEAWIGTPWFENFGNFVLKVQNINEGVAKISKLEVSIDGVVIVTAKGLARDYFAAKALKSLVNNAHLMVRMEGDQGCSIQIWIEGTFKGLGTVYGKHLYYLSRQNEDWWSANDYCGRFGGHLVKITDAKENNFVWNFCNHQGGTGIGLADIDQNQVWRWADGTLCRVLNWNYQQCGGEVHWGDPNCTLITDYGYNNWSSGEPNNCGNSEISGHCEDETYAVFTNDGTWNDVPNFSNFIIEWDYVPTSGVISDLFRQEYPEYQYPW